MTRNDLYEAAFLYKKTKLWKKLWDNHLFALRLSSGEVGYVCVMGHAGEYCSVAVYPGEAGIRSYFKIAEAELAFLPPFQAHEMILAQNCLQAALEVKDQLMPEELEEVQEYAAQHGTRLAGKNAYPQFIKYEPNRHPWHVVRREDIDMLWETLQACILLAQELENSRPEDLGIERLAPGAAFVPLFEVKGDRLISAGYAPLVHDEKTFPAVEAANELALAAVRKLPKLGVWEAEVVRMPQPAQDDPKESPYYPLFLMAVESESGYMLPVEMVPDGDERPQSLLDSFAAALRTQKACPERILCRDLRTYRLLEDFCRKCGIDLEIADGELPALDEAQDYLWKDFGGADDDPEMDNWLEDMAEMILSIPASELKNAPAGMLADVKQLLVEGLFPKALAAKLEKKLSDL